MVLRHLNSTIFWHHVVQPPSEDPLGLVCGMPTVALFNVLIVGMSLVGLVLTGGTGQHARTLHMDVWSAKQYMDGKT